MNTTPALIDVNAFYGKSATGDSEFPEIRDRLAFMDRLGISLSLVWNTEARQNHALSSNQKLIDEIARTPGAQGRIMPALAVSGLMQYERDGIQTRPLWPPNHLQAPYRDCRHYSIEKAPRLLEATLNIPCSTNLCDGDIEYVIEKLRNE